MTDPITHRSFALIVFLAVSAFFVHLPGLELRPMHGDEANQAYKTGVLFEKGAYVYDPHDHHGPILYYLALIPAFLSGAESFEETREATYRIVPVLFGAGLIALSLLLRPAFSTCALLVSGLFVAVSPAFVFYSRYYIQEILLVFFTLAAIGFGYRYFRGPSLRLTVAFGASVSLMHATKETAIIAYIAMVAGLGVVVFVYRKSERVQEFMGLIGWRHVAGFLVTAVVINIVLYTAFFTHGRGPLDSILTYGNYLKRSSGAGLHDKPWDYYLQLLIFSNKGPKYWFSEGFVVALGAIGFMVALYQTKKKTVHPLVLFLATYTVVMVVAYSLIPYKTPWTILSLYHGIILLAGYAVSCAYLRFTQIPVRVVGGLIIFAGLLHLGYQAYLTNLVLPADPRNPYVYAHTSSAHLQLAERIRGIQAIHPNPDEMRVYVIQPDGDYWPLPWYLRGVKQVGFFPNIPDAPDADMIIADPRTRTALGEALEGDYFKETGGLRPSVLRHVYIKRGLWDTYMETRQ